MATSKKASTFSAEEKSAMKERAAEVKTQTKGGDGEAEVLAKIAAMAPDDQAIASKFHDMVREVAPDLVPRTWYGMPAYATPGKSGKVICFFQDAGKFKARYATVGFSDTAALDDGSMWATTFAVREWSADNEKRLRALVTKATDSRRGD
ncbi:MAG: hypothetical protein L0H96_14935 [Humibacillus sp.]|nr:hypothetical protein [Humibacillus sp.]MDN5778195.1 hypothetical protein [Humibacillus sp.]